MIIPDDELEQCSNFTKLNFLRGGRESIGEFNDKTRYNKSDTYDNDTSARDKKYWSMNVIRNKEICL